MSAGVGPRSRLGLVRCEHCQRQFNPHSAARHIPWCKKQQSDAKRHRLSADKLEAFERYKWRISYKPSNKLPQATRNADRSTYQDEIGGQNENKQHQQKRNSSSINSSGTVSSPSAGSISSLSNSIASTNGTAGQCARQSANSRTATNAPAKHQIQAPTEQDPSASTRRTDKLKRSVSTLTLTKSRVAGSASSKNSRSSTISTTSGTIEQQDTRPGQMRCKSVSDLTSMGQIVETLAKRMEQIYAQNQLLIEGLIANRGETHCDSQRSGVRVEREVEQAAGEDEELEFAQCHHCRAECLAEANYCHKCGCKMRPSNPTPPPTN